MNLHKMVRKFLTEHINFKQLALDNKSTLPKIPTTHIYHNQVFSNMNQDFTEGAYMAVEMDRFEECPNEWVPVELIIPTQKSLNIDNLKATADVGPETKAYLLRYNGMYFVIDGHHRIANGILSGDKEIRAFVYKEN